MKKSVCFLSLSCSIFLLFFCSLLKSSAASEDGKPLIFPLPAEIKVNPGTFLIDNSTNIILPMNPSATDSFLADILSAEFTDRYETPVLIKRKEDIGSAERYILIGEISNPLIAKYIKDRNLISSLKALGEEGYILEISANSAVVAANTKSGALFGLESLRQVLYSENGHLSAQQLLVKDTPVYKFRGIKLYLPGRENIAFFKRFIKDFAALYKFNKIILELNANMRLEKHPELNVGAMQFERHLAFSRLDRPPGIHMEYQNSSHQDNADGGILEKEEVADLVNYIRKFNIEVIPELPSLTHAYYLLWGHRDLAENLAQPYPDTYCPLKPGSYDLYFDVLDEYIDVIHPEIIHVGHDEWRMEKDLCELCRGKDYGELYAADITKIHDHLAKKGIRTAIWGDHLLEAVTEHEFQTWESPAGYQYKIPGALRPEQVLKLIPKDILIFNWFWDEPSNDKKVSDFGFEQVLGNLRADINNWQSRINTKCLLGGAPSSWAATTEINFGKDQLTDFLGASNLLWSRSYLPPEKLAFVVEALAGDVNYRFRGKKLPSETGGLITTMEFSSPAINVKINSDPNSIIFLHACEHEGSNRKAYSIIHNFNETAELLGWYEIIYEDGFVETVPLRYGLNVLDLGWKQRIEQKTLPIAKASQNQYAYMARAVSKSDGTYFLYEWPNPRPGIRVKEINLKQPKKENAIFLISVSLTERNLAEQSKGNERY
jgi:hypothetical protein